MFDDLKLPAAHNTNSLLYDYAPQIFEAIRAAKMRSSVMAARTPRICMTLCGKRTKRA